MPILIRLQPEIERLLVQRARRDSKTRSALIHEALAAFLKPAKPKLGAAIRAALSDAPEGYDIERNQPMRADMRDRAR